MAWRVGCKYKFCIFYIFPIPKPPLGLRKIARERAMGKLDRDLLWNPRPIVTIIPAARQADFDCLGKGRVFGRYNTGKPKT